MKFHKENIQALVESQNQILIFSITSSEFLKEIHPHIKNSTFSRKSSHYTLWPYIDKHFQKYQCAIGAKIFQEKYRKDIKPLLDEAEEKWMSDFLAKLSKQADQGKYDAHDLAWYITGAKDFIRDQENKALMREYEDLMAQDKRSQADTVLAQLQAVVSLEKEAESEGHTLREIMEMKIDRPAWLVEGIIPQGLTILVSKPKVGKSYFIMNIAFALAEGGLALYAIPVKKTSVLYLALEDPLSRIQDRTRKIGADKAVWDSITVFAQGTWPAMHKGGIQKLRHYLDKHEDTGLVIIDTLERIRQRSSANPYSYGESYQIISEIRELAWEYKISIWANHHRTKGNTQDIFDSILGSTGDFAATDTGMVLTEEKKGRADAMLHVRGKDVERLELALDRNNFNWKLLGQGADFKRTKERQEIVNYLNQLNRPATRMEILEFREDPQGSAGTDTILRKMVDGGDIEKWDVGLYVKRHYKPSMQDDLSEKMALIKRVP